MQGGREGTHSLLMRAVILSNMTGSLRPSRLTTFILGARRETASATRNVGWRELGEAGLGGTEGSCKARSVRAQPQKVVAF